MNKKKVNRKMRKRWRKVNKYNRVFRFNEDERGHLIHCDICNELQFIPLGGGYCSRTCKTKDCKNCTKWQSLLQEDELFCASCTVCNVTMIMKNVTKRDIACAGYALEKEFHEYSEMQFEWALDWSDEASRREMFSNFYTN